MTASLKSLSYKITPGVHMYVRPGVGLQFHALPHNAVILPLESSVLPGQVLHVLESARWVPQSEEDLSRSLSACGIHPDIVQKILQELLQASILRVHDSSPQLYVLRTGSFSAALSHSLHHAQISHKVIATSDYSSLGRRHSITLTGGHVFSPPDEQFNLVKDNIIHFPIGVIDGAVALGPLIIPGYTPCSFCIDQEYRKHDNAWRGIRSQLVTKVGALPKNMLDLAASLSIRYVEAHLLPWVSAGGNPHAIPASLQTRISVNLTTFERSHEKFNKAIHCPVCRSQRMSLSS